MSSGSWACDNWHASERPLERTSTAKGCLMYEDPSYAESMAAFPIILAAVVAFIAVAINLIWILIFGKIFAKAGYHWALGLLMLVPVVNMFMPFFLAFADWPVRQELRALRQRAGAVPGQEAYRR